MLSDFSLSDCWLTREGIKKNKNTTENKTESKIERQEKGDVTGEGRERIRGGGY